MQTTNSWEMKPLGTVADFINGMAFKPSDWESAGLPIIRIQNLNGSGEYNYYSQPVDERYFVESGDLLFSWSGSRGTSFGPFIWNNSRGILNQHIFRVVVREGIDKIFLYHQLKRITEIIERRAHGSAGLVHVTKKELQKFPAIFPASISDQRAIAHILSTWDTAIDRLDRLLVAKRHLKAGLLHGFLKNKAWSGPRRSFEFGEIAERVTFKYKETEKQVPCVELEHLSQDTGEILSTTTSSKLATKTHFKQGDVLFGKLRPYLRKYAQPDFEGACSSEIWVLRGRQSICSNDFLYYLVQSHEFFSVCNKTFGSKMPRADWDLLVENYFDIPTEKDQKRIVSVLRYSDHEIRTLSKLKNSLIKQKKGLMQKLLTGKIRVHV